MDKLEFDSPFSYNEPDDSPGFLLWQTTAIWQRLIKKALEPYKISHVQFVIMAILCWFEQTDTELNQVDIARHSKLDKMTVSKALKELVIMGLTSRIENEKDTRAKLISLTVKGKTLVSQLIPIVETIDEDFFSTINKENRRNLISNFKQLSGN